MQHGEDCLAGAEEEHAAEMGEGAGEPCRPVRYTLCVCTSRSMAVLTGRGDTKLLNHAVGSYMHALYGVLPCS